MDDAGFCAFVLSRCCAVCEARMVTEKFLGIARVSMSAVFTMMGAGILLALQLVTT